MPNEAVLATERPYRILSPTMFASRPDGLDDRLLHTTFQVLLWGYALLAMLSAYGETLKKFDDVIPLVGGMMVEQGRTPNLDFYSFYPPLGLYFNAAVFHLLGRNIVAARLIGTFFFLLVMALAARFFQIRFSHSRMLKPLALLVLSEGVVSCLVLPVWPGFALAFSALLVYLCSLYLRRGRLPAVAISGILTGLALLYRVNFGGYVAAVVLLDVGLDWWLGRKEASLLSRIGPCLANALVFVLSLAMTCLAVLLAVYGKHAAAAVFQFVVIPQRLMISRGFVDWMQCALPPMFALPPAWFLFHILKGRNVVPVKALVPATLTILSLLIFHFGHSDVKAIIVLTGFEFAAVISLHVFIRRLERSEFCALVFFCGLLHYFVSRADWLHFRVLLLALALLLPFLLLPQHEPEEPASESGVSKGTALAVLFAVFVAGFGTPGLRPTPGQVSAGLRLLAKLVTHPHMKDTTYAVAGDQPAVAWQSVYHDTDELHAVRYLREKTSASDAIFVANPDQSRVFYNDLRPYWLADRPIGVRTFQLETRTATEANVQSEIIFDLKRNDVKWILIDNVPDSGDSTFLAQNYVGAKLLDQYIASQYREEARFGPYAILSRRGDAPAVR